MAPASHAAHLHNLGGRDVVLSVLIHGILLVLMVTVKGCEEDRGPLFNPEDIMEVQMMPLPKAAGRLPDRATRAPAPAATAAPSDTMGAPAAESDMVLETPAIETPRATSTQDRASRDDLLAKLRQETAPDLAAPLGDQDRSASDPDSTLSPDEVFAGLGTGAPMDPDLARYTMAVRGAVLPNWAPLPRIIEANPELFTVVEVILGPTGTISRARVVRTSGNTSYDESCVRAVHRTSRLPLPPERFSALARKGIWIHFPASDAE